jgi:hypothetical protein
VTAVARRRHGPEHGGRHAVPAGRATADAGATMLVAPGADPKATNEDGTTA